MLSRDGYECGKRCYSDQHNSTLTASKMLLTDGIEQSKMNGKSDVEENWVLISRLYDK